MGSLFASSTRTEPYVYWNMDGGSASSSGALRVAIDTTIRITPHVSAYGYWAYWAVKSNGLAGLAPHFLVTVTNHYSLMSGEWLACWATANDTDTWHAFDHVTIGASDIEFYNDSAFPAGVIHIAALPMFPWRRYKRLITAWLADDRVSDTSSSTDGIISYTTRRTLWDGRTAPALPLYGFKLTGDRVGSKNKAVLMAGSHATETPGAFMFEGAMAWLLGGSTQAETLLDYFEFFVYPCANPQGVYSGWFRTSPEAPATSHDWCWNAGSAGINESVDTLKTAMNTDTGGAVQVGLDFHSYMSSTDIHAAVNTGNTTGLYEYFRAEMAALDSDFNLLAQDLSQASAVFFQNTLGAGLAMTMEQGSETGRGVAEWKTYGGQIMRALYEMLVDGRFTYGP